MRISDWSADVCSSDLSILCWIAFVVASSLCSIGAVVALPISHHATHWFVRRWARFHRLICRFILGHRIVVEGAMPDIPVLYVFKHEGAFETLQPPMPFRWPAVPATADLFSIPVWAPAARFYRLRPADPGGR